MMNPMLPGMDLWIIMDYSMKTVTKQRVPAEKRSKNLALKGGILETTHNMVSALSMLGKLFLPNESIT